MPGSRTGGLCSLDNAAEVTLSSGRRHGRGRTIRVAYLISGFADLVGSRRHHEALRAWDMRLCRLVLWR